MSSLSSIKYVQPNSLTPNIKEKINELHRKIILNCTLKRSNQKQNVITLVGDFKDVVQNILQHLDQEHPDYNILNFDELNDLLKKTYKELSITSCNWMSEFKLKEVLEEKINRKSVEVVLSMNNPNTLSYNNSQLTVLITSTPCSKMWLWNQTFRFVEFWNS